MFLSVFDCIVSHFRCIDTSLHVFLSLCLSFSVFVSVSEYIIGNWYVCDQSRSARSACNTHYKRLQSLIQNHMPVCGENSAIDNLFLIISLCVCYVRLLVSISFSLSECQYQCPAILWLIVCAYTSLHRDTYSLALWISAWIGYIVTHCSCICTSLDACFSVFSLNASIGFRLYCHWLSVYRFVSWSAFLSVFLFVLVSAYIAANSACICTSLYPYFSLLPDR